MDTPEDDPLPITPSLSLCDTCRPASCCLAPMGCWKALCDRQTEFEDEVRARLLRLEHDAAERKGTK